MPDFFSPREERRTPQALDGDGTRSTSLQRARMRCLEHFAGLLAGTITSFPELQEKARREQPRALEAIRTETHSPRYAAEHERITITVTSQKNQEKMREGRGLHTRNVQSCSSVARSHACSLMLQVCSWYGEGSSYRRFTQARDHRKCAAATVTSVTDTSDKNYHSTVPNLLLSHLEKEVHPTQCGGLNTLWRRRHCVSRGTRRRPASGCTPYLFCADLH